MIAGRPGPDTDCSEDFHTRLLNEHWNARHQETRDQIQRRIEEILRRKR